ncbi:MAG: sigma-70 family RNA polymerase sigma factor [Empedobacter falsenii]|uniref:sigma-70 family RNA polymerase sigma factor n=1 Tax=unclassified Empedobacter TaxID=2643773 RepID=UPI0025C1A07A|nr:MULTISPECIES: sigma-70 family RNA polymerase sigma factor [unclassified Empedobacter]
MNQFKKIYDDYKHKVYYFVKKYISNEQDIEDIVQDIFIHVWKHQSNLTTENFEAIIFKTSKQEIANFYRRNKLQFSFIENDIIDDDNIVEEIDPQKFTKASRLLEQLPDKTRDFFIKNRIEQISYSKIAKENNLSKTAVEKHVKKAIFYLKANL